jgi:hypothetical protein
MTPSPRRRDTVRLGISSVTALVGVGSLTAVGWFAGAAARQHTTEQQRTEADRSAAYARAAEAKARYDAAMARRRSASFRRHVVFRPRPTRTVVRTQYVQSAAAPVTVGGGTVSTPSHAAPPPAGPVHSAPPPPPPPPPRPPAPSSGS